MHIPHSIPHVPLGIAQPGNLQNANGRKTAAKKFRELEEDDESLLDVVMLSDAPHEEEYEDPQEE
jgi:hypothetical protein